MTSEKNGGNLVTFQWINPKTNRPSLFLATKQRGGNADYDDVIFSDAANKAQFSQLFRTGSTTEFALDLHGYLFFFRILVQGNFGMISNQNMNFWLNKYNKYCPQIGPQPTSPQTTTKKIDHNFLCTLGCLIIRLLIMCLES